MNKGMERRSDSIGPPLSAGGARPPGNRGSARSGRLPSQAKPISGFGPWTCRHVRQLPSIWSIYSVILRLRVIGGCALTDDQVDPMFNASGFVRGSIQE